MSNERPKCEECNSEKVISRGKEWYCRDCGHYFSKIKRKKKGLYIMNENDIEVVDV